jgi:hypothetical protein
MTDTLRILLIRYSALQAQNQFNTLNSETPNLLMCAELLALYLCRCRQSIQRHMRLNIYKKPLTKCHVIYNVPLPCVV